VTVAGVATDAGGGVVGGVEVSLDGGATWHPASGREGWSYTGTATVSGSGLIRARATDDSGNLEGRPTGGPATGAGGPGTGAGGPRAAPPAAHQPSSADHRAPRVRVSPRRARVSRRGVVKLRVACPRGERSCRVRLRLRLRHRWIASRTLTVKGGHARTFSLRLTRTARRRLAAHRTITVVAFATARDRAANRATTKTRIKLLRAKGGR
jgi:hypothetical protein